MHGTLNTTLSTTIIYSKYHCKLEAELRFIAGK